MNSFRPIQAILLAVLGTSLAAAQVSSNSSSMSGPTTGISRGSFTQANQSSQHAGLNVVTTDRSLLYPAPTDYHLVPGDLISVSSFDRDYSVTIRLDPSSSARLPMLGTVSFAGLTIEQAQDVLAQKLVQAGIYRDPIITINLVESPNSNATVYGEVNAVVPVLSRRRLIDVIIAAGGLPTSASHIITINRPGVEKPLVLDMGPNPYTSAASNVPVLPGDSVFINREGIVYMVDSFVQQGVITLSGNQKLTLMQATALSGGPDIRTAKYSDLHLIRTVNGQRTIVNMNIGDVLYGKAPDPVLQPDDIVFLPSSGLKVALTNGGLSAVLSAVSIAVSALSLTR